MATLYGVVEHSIMAAGETELHEILNGVFFGIRGVRLLGQDVGSAGTLFWRALIGMLCNSMMA